MNVMHNYQTGKDARTFIVRDVRHGQVPIQVVTDFGIKIIVLQSGG